MPERVVVEALGPLVFPSRKPATQFSQSLGYIPAIALWGALGERMQSTPIGRFSHALPARSTDSWVRVLPATSVSCKQQPGFLTNPGPSAHGAFDTLFDRICWEVLRPAAFTYDPHCLACSGRTDTFAGFYAPGAQSDTSYQKREVAQRLLTRVAIDRQRGTAAEGQLYSPLAIAEVMAPGDDALEPTRFSGSAWDLTDAERAALVRIDSLGGRRSSGLGRVRVTLQNLQSAQDLPERLDNFNATFQGRWALMAAAHPTLTPDWSPKDWTLFSIGLQTEAVFLESGCQPSLVLSPAQILEEIGLPVTTVRAWASSRITGGWNMRWNRHRPTTMTVSAGTVYVFRTQAARHDVLRALQQMEEQGIGEQRAEGCGVVYMCDPWHSDATGAAV